MDKDAVGEDFQVLPLGWIRKKEVGDAPFANDRDGIVFFLVIPEAYGDEKGELFLKFTAGKIPRKDEPLSYRRARASRIGRSHMGACEI